MFNDPRTYVLQDKDKRREMELNFHQGKTQVNPAAHTANLYDRCVFTSGQGYPPVPGQLSLSPARTVAMLGAETEAAMGMPTPRELIPRIADWLRSDTGKAIDTALRKTLPRLTFHYEKFVDQAIDRLTRGLGNQREKISGDIRRELEVNGALNETQRKMGELITRLLGKIDGMKNEAAIDEETERLVSDVLGIAPTDDSILDFSKTSYTRYFQDVISSILHRSLNDSQDPILRHVYTQTLDIERLLARHFSGFYAGERGSVKSYMYISWTMWAYLSLCQRERDVRTGGHPLSATLAQLGSGKDLQVVNLNYTTLPVSLERPPLYLRGTLEDYVDVENKNDIHLEDLSQLDLVDFFENQLPAQVSLEGERVSLPIPSFMPPMKMMTLVSGRYIPTWYQVTQAIAQADRLLLLGPRLDPEKGYLNDLLRLNPATEIIAVTPDMATTCCVLCRVLQLDANRYTPTRIQGHKARKYGNRVTVINANLPEIDLSEWLG